MLELFLGLWAALALEPEREVLLGSVFFLEFDLEALPVLLAFLLEERLGLEALVLVSLALLLDLLALTLLADLPTLLLLLERLALGLVLLFDRLVLGLLSFLVLPLLEPIDLEEVLLVPDLLLLFDLEPVFSTSIFLDLDLEADFREELLPLPADSSWIFSLAANLLFDLLPCLALELDVFLEVLPVFFLLLLKPLFVVPIFGLFSETSSFVLDTDSLVELIL